VGEIVHSVLIDNTNRRVTVMTDIPDLSAKASKGKASKDSKKKRASATKKPKVDTKEASTIIRVDDSMLGKACPICGKGIIIKGKTAYGCSDWKNGCTFRQNF